MEYALLGRTSCQVSRLGFGGAPAGLKNYLGRYDPGSVEAQGAVVRAIRRALELGVNYFDTAPGYGGGIGEAIFGHALEGASRDVFVATKCGLGHKEGLRQSVEASLSRLRRKRIDLLQLHGSSWRAEDVSRILGPGGIADQLDDLRREGLIRFTGFTSEDNNDGLYTLIRSGRFDVVQLCYNLLHQHPYDPIRPFGSMFLAEERGLGIVTMRSTTSGTLQRWTRAIRPDDDFDYSAALLQFTLSNPLVDVALVGMRTAEEVEKNVRTVADTAGRVDIKKLHTRYEQ